MPVKTDYGLKIVDAGETTITIASGQTTSSIQSAGGAAFSALIIPSGWTTCDISFKAGKSPTELYPLYIPNDIGASTLYSITNVIATGWLNLIPIFFHDISYLQIVCSTAQAADVVVDTIMAPYYTGIKG